MLCIRAQRLGKKNKPFYKIVVLDEENGRDKQFLEKIGYFSPFETNGYKVFWVDFSKLGVWLYKGAQPKGLVIKLFFNLFKNLGLYEGQGY